MRITSPENSTRYDEWPSPRKSPTRSVISVPTVSFVTGSDFAVDGGYSAMGPSPRTALEKFPVIDSAAVERVRGRRRSTGFRNSWIPSTAFAPESGSSVHRTGRRIRGDAAVDGDHSGFHLPSHLNAFAGVLGEHVEISPYRVVGLRIPSAVLEGHDGSYRAEDLVPRERRTVLDPRTMYGAMNAPLGASPAIVGVVPSDSAACTNSRILSRSLTDTMAPRSFD